jgi:hypothetical protein
LEFPCSYAFLKKKRREERNEVGRCKKTEGEGREEKDGEGREWKEGKDRERQSLLT